MRYLYVILSILFIMSGCVPTSSDPGEADAPDTSSQFKNNISTLYGMGGKIPKDYINELASNIIWKDSLGNIQSLDSLKGKKVLINFWAIWCSPCEAEMKDLESISESDEAVVIGVCVIDKHSSLFERAKLYAETRKLKFQIVTDPFSKTYINYGGDGTIPWTFAIDRDGYIAYKFIGQQSKDRFMDVLEQIP
jgi:thiol-disulfide isomerase/thioredoxin